jgi:sugar phosphate isomerase/epimerase
MPHLDRRSLLATLAAGGAMAALPAAARGRAPFFTRIGKPVGLQVYTLGPDAGKDVDATFAQIAAIGYREIELPGLLGKTPAELAAAAARAGLRIASLHVPLLATGGPLAMTLNSEPARLAETLGTLGARWAVAPITLIPTNFRPAAGEAMGAAIARTVAEAGADIWKQTAEQLNRAGSGLAAHGIGVGYHNHNLEFRPIGATTGWDILLAECDPRLVSFQLDLGWVATAGLDPVRFLKRMHGRVRLLHVKDVAAGNPQSYQLSMRPAEVGSGTLDWRRILPAAHKAGVEHYLVEQEPPFTIPRIEAAERSFRFLSQLRA